MSNKDGTPIKFGLVVDLAAEMYDEKKFFRKYCTSYSDSKFEFKSSHLLSMMSEVLDCIRFHYISNKRNRNIPLSQWIVSNGNIQAPWVDNVPNTLQELHEALKPEYEELLVQILNHSDIESSDDSESDASYSVFVDDNESGSD